MAIRIASVEDNQAQSELIRDILTSSGYECECFSNGDAFVKALRDRTFDLLLLDWQLPDISGIQLVSWVRQTVGPALPVLFLTNRSLEDDVVRGLAAGADDYVIKPVRRAELQKQHDIYSDLLTKIEGIKENGQGQADVLKARLLAPYEAERGDATAFISQAYQSIWGHQRQFKAV